MSKEKIALAYSGGLDTSVMIKWLKDKYGAEIVAVTGNLGQQKEIENLESKALSTGASKFQFLDLRKEFVEEYIWRALKAGALYEDVYPLATALGRPLLAKAIVDTALAEGCTMLAHGCTGKGNDQVRFEVTFASLAPHLKVLAPLREWEFTSREAEIAYANEHNIPVSATKKSPYSIDENIWGISIECGVLEDPMVAPPEDAYQITTSPENAPDTPAVVDIEFEKGIPVSLDAQKATMKIGSRIPIATGSYQTGAATAVVSSLVNTQFQYQDVGVNIEMTPTVHYDRDVTLKIKIEVTSQSGSVTISGVTEPILSQRSSSIRKRSSA